jgi:hypothetical protein
VLASLLLGGRVEEIDGENLYERERGGTDGCQRECSGKGLVFSVHDQARKPMEPLDGQGVIEGKNLETLEVDHSMYFPHR